jgi:hypothetical protein
VLQVGEKAHADLLPMYCDLIYNLQRSLVQASMPSVLAHSKLPFLATCLITSLTAPSPLHSAAARVTVRGADLFYDGKPIRLHGINWFGYV